MILNQDELIEKCRLTDNPYFKTSQGKVKHIRIYEDALGRHTDEDKDG